MHKNSHMCPIIPIWVSWMFVLTLHKLNINDYCNNVISDFDQPIILWSDLELLTLFLESLNCTIEYYLPKHHTYLRKPALFQFAGTNPQTRQLYCTSMQYKTEDSRRFGWTSYTKWEFSASEYVKSRMTSSAACVTRDSDRSLSQPDIRSRWAWGGDWKTRDENTRAVNHKTLRDWDRAKMSSLETIVTISSSQSCDKKSSSIATIDRIVHGADSALCLLLLFPSMVFFWRGIWDLYGVYIYPGQQFESALGTFLLGSCSIFGYLLLPVCDWSFHKLGTTTCAVLTRFYIFAYSILYMAYWKGVWTLADYFLEPYGWLAGVIGFCVIYPVTVLLRVSRTAIFPPFVVVMDSREDALGAATRFKVQVCVLELSLRHTFSGNE